jgi:hypothetical protein
MDLSRNRFLTLAPGVIQTPETDPVIYALDSRFAMRGVKARVTSIKRTPEDQLRIIRDYCVKKGVVNEFPEILFDRPVTGRDEVTGFLEPIYYWQRAWSRLLNIGVIINPPMGAKCLFDYINKEGVNKIGQIILPSPHFFGKSFDIGGGPNGIGDELDIVKMAAADPKVGIKKYVIERENNAIHIDVVTTDIESAKSNDRF